MTPVFFLRYQSSPLVLIGAPRKGQASNRVTPWIAPGLPHAQVGLQSSHSCQSFSQIAPHHLHYQASDRNAVGLVPSSTRWHHTTNAVDVVLQDLQALPSTTMVRAKHRVIRGVQTSLKTRPNT
jgi:hypothetical protein